MAAFSPGDPLHPHHLHTHHLLLLQTTPTKQILLLSHISSISIIYPSVTLYRLTQKHKTKVDPCVEPCTTRLSTSPTSTQIHTSSHTKLFLLTLLFCVFCCLLRPFNCPSCSRISLVFSLAVPAHQSSTGIPLSIISTDRHHSYSSWPLVHPFPPHVAPHTHPTASPTVFPHLTPFPSLTNNASTTLPGPDPPSLPLPS